MTKSSRILVNNLVQLCIVQPWAAERLEELEDLLDECVSENEQILLCELIKRFTYLDGVRQNAALSAVVGQICDDWALDPNTTVVSAASADRYPDSGALVAYELRTELRKRGWNSDRILARYDRIHQVSWQPTAVVLVDEFVGTGSTFKSRFNTIRQNLKAKGWLGVPIYAAVYAGMRFSRGKLRDIGYQDVFYANELLKGISEQADSKAVAVESVLMQAMEDRLEDVLEEEPLPRFGYGACEALYWRDRGNIPNSVFPIFWWGERKVRKPRRVLFTRA